MAIKGLVMNNIFNEIREETDEDMKGQIREYALGILFGITVIGLVFIMLWFGC